MVNEKRHYKKYPCSAVECEERIGEGAGTMTRLPSTVAFLFGMVLLLIAASGWYEINRDGVFFVDPTPSAYYQNLAEERYREQALKMEAGAGVVFLFLGFVLKGRKSARAARYR